MSSWQIRGHATLHKDLSQLRLLVFHPGKMAGRQAGCWQHNNRWKTFSAQKEVKGERAAMGATTQIAFSHAQIGQTVLRTRMRMRMRMPNPEQLAANSISSSSIALRHIARNSTGTARTQTPALWLATPLLSTPVPSIRIAFQYINIYTQANLCTAELPGLPIHCEIWSRWRAKFPGQSWSIFNSACAAKMKIYEAVAILLSRPPEE